MKSIKYLLVIIFSFLLISGCSNNDKEAKNDKISYNHYLRGGGSEKLDATILWEYSNNTFTKYQVAYTSYICSDPSVNFANVIYIEITNKGTKQESLIRNISFSTIEEDEEVFNVGVWGDYKKALGKEFYPAIENELMPKLRYAKYDFIKSIADQGYGNYKGIEGINSDAITGGTISASNIVSIVKSIFDYHIEKYY